MMNTVAEIGINYAFGEDRKDFHKNVITLIDIAAVAGCTHVKFQKRNPIATTPSHKMNEPKSVPWSKEKMTYIQYKQDIEFSIDEMGEFFDYARSKDLSPFASVWDIDSCHEMSDITSIGKIPSALLTNDRLLRAAHHSFPVRILSTGMSTEEEIEHAIEIYEPHILFHTNSTYPTPVPDLNMGYIYHLQEKYPDCEIGFSNHAFGIVPMIAATVTGITWVEFHLTLDHTYWGSDQSSSVEPIGALKLVRAIRNVEIAFAKGNCDRVLYPGEEKKRSDLRV
jgi:N-acetylneuraminate synthase